MSLLLILFAKVVLGTVTVRQPFDTFVGSQSESFSFTLTDYFIGPNLNYSISTDSEAPWYITLNDPFNFTMLSQQYYKKGTSATNLSKTRKLRSYRSDTTYILGYYSNNLTSYSFTNQTLTEIWTVFIDNSANNVFIQDIAVSATQNCIYAVVSYTTGTITTRHFTNVFIAKDFLQGVPNFVMVPGFQLLPQQSIRIEASGLFVAILNSTTNDLSSQGSVILYNVTDPVNPILVDSATGTHNPVDIGFYDFNTLIISDSVLGLQKYEVTNDQVILYNELLQEGMGSLDFSGSYAVVTLSNTVVQVDVDAFVIDSFVNLYSSNASVPASAVAGKMVGSYSFVITQTINANLAVVDFDLLPNQGQVKNWDLAILQTGNFDQFGPYNLFQNADGSFAYVRLDNFIITLSVLTVGDWELSGFTTSDNFTASITAEIAGNTTDNATLTFNAISVGQEKMIPYSNNSIFDGQLSIDLETFSIYIDLDTEIFPNQYFGGSYQLYNVTLSPLLNVSLKIIQPDKVTFDTIGAYQNITSLSASGNVFIMSDGTDVSAYNVTGIPNYNKFFSFNFQDSFPGALVNSTLWTGESVITYSDEVPGIVIASDFAIESITPPQNCIQLKAYNGFLYCGNSSSIIVYELEPFSNPLLIATINATTFGISELSFSDITFGTGTANQASIDYLFIADKSGILVASLDQLSRTPPVFTVYGPLGTSSNVLQALTTGDQFALVNFDGSADIYKVNYASYPTISQSLPGRGSAASASLAGGILLIQYAEIVDVIDLYADPLNAFYISYSSPACLSAAGFLNSTYSLSICNSSSTLTKGESLAQSDFVVANLTSVTIYGTRESSGSQLDYPITMSIYSSDVYYQTQGVIATGTIIAYNAYDSATIDFNVTIVNQSPYLISIFNETSITSEYNTSMQINISPYFIGQSLSYRLNINGDFYPYTTEFLPATIAPKYRTIDVEAINDAIDFYVCPGCNVSAILTETAVLLIDNLNLTEIVANINYSYPSSNCNSISSIYLGNNTYQMFLNCFENLSTLGSDPLNIFRVGVNTNLGTGVSEVSYYPVLSAYYFIKSVLLSPLSCLNYQVTNNIDDDGNFVDTKFYVSYFYYFNGMPINSDSWIEYSQESLGLSSLSISAVDSYYVDLNHAYVYMADASFGVRIFDVKYDIEADSLTQTLVTNLALDPIIPVSIGVCDNWLFVGGLNEDVYQYNLTLNPLSPEFVQSFYKTGNYSCVNGNIHCNAAFDPTLVVVPMITDNNLFDSRVLDLRAASYNAIYADLEEIYYYSGSAYFTNSSRVRSLSSTVFYDFGLNEPILQINSMTHSQYKMMLEYFGTSSFDVYITAHNDYLYINTETFTLERTNGDSPYDPDDHDDTDDDDAALELVVAAWVGLVFA